LPVVQVLPGTTNVFLASTGDLLRDPEALARRFEERAIEARLVSPAFLRYIYTNERFADAQIRTATTPAPVNTDRRPVCYRYTLMLWLSKYFPSLTLADPPEIDPRGFTWWSWALVAAGAVALVLRGVRRWRRTRRVLLAAVAGCAGMVVEAVVIVDYQVRSGVLYRDLGVLLMLFMAGLALGAAVTPMLVARAGAAGDPQRAHRLLGGGLLLGFTVAGVAHAAYLVVGVGGGLLVSATMLLVSGALVAALFAYASLDRVEHQRAIVSPLYAADLVGGCVGSLATSLLLIPILGLAGTMLGMAGLALVTLALL
jgi:spermidine synthase